MQRLEKRVKFECPECHDSATSEVRVTEPNWRASEKMPELTSESETVVVCNLCSAVFSAYVRNRASDCTVILDHYPELEVLAYNAFFLPREDDEWLNTDLPENPSAIFMNSYHHAGDILAEYGIGGSGVLSHSAFIINRMVFAQQISALEAFLGDTLIQQVKRSKIAMDRLLANDSDLKEVKISLAEIANSPDIVSKIVEEYLQKILYHNLSKVAVLYKIALGVEIWPDEIIRKCLFRAIQYRHDCVHRNGRNKDGNELQVFTTPYVKEILDAMLNLVNHIAANIQLHQTLAHL